MGGVGGVGEGPGRRGGGCFVIKEFELPLRLALMNEAQLPATPPR